MIKKLDFSISKKDFIFKTVKLGGIIKEYSIKLKDEINKKYSYRTLYRMKQFYN